MLPTVLHRSDGKWDKWGVSNMSKALALALVLLLSLQILTWNGRSLVQFPCPFSLADPPPVSTPAPSPAPDTLSSITQTNKLPTPTPNCTLVEDELQLKELELKHKDEELKQKVDELKRKDEELKQKDEVIKQRDAELKRKEEQLEQLQPPPPPPRNSYFADADADIWGCSQHRVPDELNMTYHDWTTGDYTDQQALCAAHRQAKRPMSSGTPRIAFLFLTRGPIPTEPIWRKFFSGHEDKYSIYVHATDPTHEFAPNSLFHNRTIPSKPFMKMRISLPEAIRRLLSFALLDAATPNAWFHVLCDSSIPIRSFPFAYDYITRSEQSFVEAFYPSSPWWRESWNTTGDMAIPDGFMRKGEAWVTVHRRHAGLIVGDHHVFPRFKHHWFEWGIPSELYIPTLLTVADPLSIANRSLVYVNWVHSIRRTSSPVLFNLTNVSPDLIQGIQNLTSNVHGFYQVDKTWNDTTEQSCVYNGVPNSPCFLFARKFNGAAENIAKLVSLSPVLGYA